MSMYRFQASLPHLPIPDLEDTCARLLEWSHPLLNPAEVETTRQAAETFLTTDEGNALQSALIDWGTRHPDNWLSPLWGQSYLDGRAPLPFNNNVAFVLEPSPTGLSREAQVAHLIAGLTDFHELIRTEKLEVDRQRDTPLCMAQYRTLLGTTRIPGDISDTLVNTSDSSHFIVIHNGHLLRVQVSRNPGIPSLTGELEQWVSATTTQTESPGVFTALERNEWARIRRQLIEYSPSNQDAMQTVESALAVIILDDTRPTDDTEGFRIAFCGNPDDRWYDKSLQFIFDLSGGLAVNYEHSGVDGTTLGRLVRYLSTPTPGKSQTASPDAHTLSPLEFTWDESLRKERALALEDYNQRRDQIAFRTLLFDAFGKNRIKSLGVSPDAFIQCALQRAQSLALGKVLNTYEAAMTKRFLLGRTEAMRPVTQASLRFVQDPTPETLREAASAHIERIRLCQNGKGVDRHLYGLKEMHKRLHPDTPLPALFTSPGYLELTANRISTSTSRADHLRFAGYGPSLPDGFAVRYLIHPDSLHFVLSSLDTRHEDLNRLHEALLETLDLMGSWA